MVRPPYFDSSGIKKGAWNEEEDFMLRSHIEEFGHQNWRLVPIRAGLDRCGKSCRLRWVNYLKPGLRRGNFTAQEEDLIIRLHAQLGNKWSSIAKHLPGRTDNEVKNHWHAHLKKCRSRQNRAAKVMSSEPSSSCITSSEDDHHHQQNELFSTAAKPQDMNSAISQTPPDHHYYCEVDQAFTAAAAVNQAHFSSDMLQFADDNGQIYWDNMETLLLYHELLMQNAVENDSLNSFSGYASDDATGVTSSTVDSLNSEAFMFGEDSLWL